MKDSLKPQPVEYANPKFSLRKKQEHEGLLREGYNIDALISNQRYKNHNEIIKQLIDKYVGTHTLQFSFNCYRNIQEELTEIILKIGNSILNFSSITNDEKQILIESSEYDCFGYVFLTQESLNYYFEITLFGKANEDLQKCKENITSIFSSYIIEKNNNSLVNIHYYYLTKEGIPAWFNILEEIETKLFSTNYPFIEDPNSFITNYFNSKESILILIGSPGTGKTRFIRYLLSMRENSQSIFFTSDKHVIEHGCIFSDFIQSSSNIMVLEDFDFHLNSRKEGNTIMYHLLGLGDGLIQSQNKKIIISTNLSNLSGIDDAILRRGRCFDIVNFRLLYWDEVIIFLKENNREDLISKIEEKEYSLADLYALINDKKERNFKIECKRTGFN